jgi:hypothetical protein
MPSFKGALKRMDDKSIMLEMGDNRVLDFKRTGKTKFLKAGEEIKSPKFNVGDELSIEATEEPGGYLTAVNVYWEKAGSGETASATRSPEKDRASGAPDAWGKDDPDRPVLKRGTPDNKPAAPDSKQEAADKKPAASDNKPAASPDPEPSAEAPGKPVATAEAAPAPAKRDEDDPGRPILRRGGPAQRSAAASSPADAPSKPVETAAAAPPSPGVFRTVDEPGTSIPVVRRGANDDLIRKATDAALEFTETLPAYVVQQLVTRYQGDGKPIRWQALDTVRMAVVFENGKEDYRDITVNGKPKNSLAETGGAWSTGEFGSVLIDLFSPATAADFMYRRDTRINGISAKMYDYSVTRDHSHWNITMGAQSYSPAYKGSVWIDPSNGRVMRIEMQAQGFPGAFPADTVESATDYQYIRLGDARQYLLPVHSENLSCQRGSDICSKNTIDFRNYKKYSGESTITFEPVKDKE